MNMSFVEEEKEPTGESQKIERQEPSEWRYVETPLSAEVHIGDIRLRPHWRGYASLNEGRASGFDVASVKAREALALVDGPAKKEKP